MLSPHLTICKPQLISTFSIFKKQIGVFLKAIVRKPMIIINAILLKRLKAYLTIRKIKHAIKVVVRAHLLVTLLACPKIYLGYWFKSNSEHTCLVKMVDMIFQLELP
jgi:hypothetical protein